VSYAGFWGQAYLPVDQFIDKAAELGYDGVMLMAKRPHVSVLDFGADECARPSERGASTFFSTTDVGRSIHVLGRKRIVVDAIGKRAYARTSCSAPLFARGEVTGRPTSSACARGSITRDSRDWKGGSHAKAPWLQR